MRKSKFAAASVAAVASVVVVSRPAAAVPTDPHAQIVSSNAGTTVFDGININQIVGAETFYAHGYWGRRAVLANVEAGHVWNGHESLAHVATYLNDPSIDGATRQYDWHATMVGQVLSGSWILYGLEGTGFKSAAFFGMAPDAQLWSTAIASGWNADPDPTAEFAGSFNLTDASLVYGYQRTMQTGVNGRRADVVNSSWGFDDPAGSDGATVLVDALAYANHPTVVMAAGNHESGSPKVSGPGSGYNGIAVGALSSDTSAPPYGAVAVFSNTAPNDYYNPKTGVTKANVRAAVDIVAPGDNLTLAFYGGLTGGHTSGTDPVGGAGAYYVQDMAGTSFAAPVVAGGAGLLVDVGYDRFTGGTSVDGRVVKAVLLNSARKLQGWNNGQADTHGVVTTTQSLDYAQGAGALDLAAAFEQYTAGTTDLPGTAGGLVDKIGWDFGQVAPGSPNDYRFGGPLLGGSTMTATLDWFVTRTFDEATTDVKDVQFIDLDLLVYRSLPGGGSELVAQSISPYNVVEHLSFVLPDGGDYFMRVLWAGENYDLPGITPDATDYALAWSAVAVPEPAASLFMVALALTGTLRRRRRAVRRVTSPAVPCGSASGRCGRT
jgi:hypothetical protein